MLDLRRLRLLRELHARGTIAAVAEALRFTPSAVSQQLAVLERSADRRERGAPEEHGGGEGEGGAEGHRITVPAKCRKRK